MSDPTESIRKELIVQINAEPGSSEALENEDGQIWDDTKCRGRFDVLGFGAPLVVVRRKADGAAGIACSCSTSPRFYFNFHTRNKAAG